MLHIFTKKFIPIFAVLLLSLSVGFAQTNEKAAARSIISEYLTEKAAAEKTAVNVEYRIGDDIEENHKTRSIFVQQQHDGIDLKGAVMGYFITKDGRKIVNDDLTNEVIVSANAPVLSAEQAIRAATDYSGDFPMVAALQEKESAGDAQMTTVFDKGDIAAGDFKARLVYLPTSYKSRKFRLAWETQAFTKDRQHYWLTHVDALDGNILERQDLVLHCSFGGEEYDYSPEEQKEHDHHQHLMHLEAAKDMEEAIAVSKADPAVPLADMPFVFSNSAATTAAAAVAGPNHTFLALALPADSPYEGAQSVVSVSDGDDNASPYGWTSLNGSTEELNTKGNNVYSFYDPSPGPLGGAPASVTPPSTNGGPTGVSDWNYPWDLTEEPEYTQGSPTNFPNRDAAIVNLFYLNNMMHDIFYPFGFDEKNRNFQNTNIFNGTDRGGAGGDEVLAQAQDGGGTNNANMLTLADGTNGQMQMYLWTSVEAADLVKVDYDGDGTYETEYNALQGSFANAPGANVNLFTNPVTAEYIIINEGCTGTATNSTGTTGCGPGAPMVGAGLPPCNDISGKIVIIDRGDCSFVEKVNGAEQNATGLPAGIIIVNNDTTNPDAVISMGGTDAAANTIQTPAVMISFNDGAALKAAVSAGTINGELRRDVAPAPKRDGDFDNGVIGHEYGHGISTRSSIRTQGGLGTLSGAEQGGEGWSDFWGLYITMTQSDLNPATAAHPNGVLPTRGIGNYVTYQPADGPGIRPRPYSIDFNINEYTFAGTAANRLGVNDVNPDSPHGVGFIWCTMLYGVWQEFIDVYGFNDDLFNDGSDLTTAGGNNIFNRLVIRGIQIQNSATFVEQRDAIIQADEELYNGEHFCMIWQAFARRGLGFNVQGSDTALGGEVDDFTVHPNCSPTAILRMDLNGPTNVPNNSIATYTVNVENLAPTATTSTNVSVTLPAGTTDIVPSNGGTVSGTVVTWPQSIPGSTTVTYTVDARINTATFTNDLFFDDNEGTQDMWNNLDGGLPGDAWAVTQNDPFTGSNVWFVPDPDNASDQSLRTANPIAVPADGKMVFHHKYSTEKDFDVGVVEISTSGNAGPWTDLGDFMTTNTYNNTVPATNNPVLFGALEGMAFGGASGPDYLSTEVDLNSFAGQNAFFRWRFSADVATPGVGWWVDNVVVGTDITYAPVSADVTFDGTANLSASTETLVLAAALPVELTDFTATAREKDILLTWETAQELNNRGFNIERRAENEIAFRNIGWADGAGDSETPTAYDFVDKNAETGVTYYYRLLQEDFDGRSDYSMIRKARIESLENEVSLQPNPTKGAVTLAWERSVGTYSVEVFDAAGKSVLRADRLEDAFFRFDLSDFAKQMYTVRIITADETISKRLILQ